MPRLWARIIKKHRIDRQATAECPREGVEDALTELCHEFDIPRPIWLNKHQREVNLHGAFTVAEPENITGKTIILIDDVCTTGSTLAEVTDTLLSAGAEKVCCACACKTPELQADDETTEV